MHELFKSQSDPVKVYLYFYKVLLVPLISPTYSHTLIHQYEGDGQFRLLSGQHGSMPSRAANDTMCKNKLPIVSGWELVSPASLLDSQHRCIASPHAKESGQTPVLIWSPLVLDQEVDLIVVGCGFIHLC